MRRGDREDTAVRRGSILHVAVQSLGKRRRVGRIAAAGVRGGAQGCSGEITLGLFFALREDFVVKERGLRKRLGQVTGQLADVELSGEADQVFAQVELTMVAVEKFEAPDHRRGNNQRRVGVAERIAQHQAGLIGNR